MVDLCLQGLHLIGARCELRLQRLDFTLQCSDGRVEGGVVGLQGDVVCFESGDGSVHGGVGSVEGSVVGL